MKQLICRICGSKNNKLIYEGLIRNDGGSGNEFVDGFKYYQCNDCELVYINNIPKNIDSFYESSEFQLKFLNEKKIRDLQSRYDNEQNDRISRIGVDNLRGKVVADIGCGAGLFLDCIIGIAKKTIAVEPSKNYRKYLREKGHHAYAYLKNLNTDEKIDVVTSFDVIEHIEDISGFLKSIYSKLDKMGMFYLSMPQHNDIVRKLCPEKYESFFYQTAHLNYFNEKSIKIALKNAGFKKMEVSYLHKYKIGNIIQWALNGKPGSIKTSIFDESFDNIFKSEMQRLGIASHLFLKIEK